MPREAGSATLAVVRLEGGGFLKTPRLQKVIARKGIILVLCNPRGRDSPAGGRVLLGMKASLTRCHDCPAVGSVRRASSPEGHGTPGQGC